MSDNKIILNRKLLSSQARIQVPWVKVTIGDYTFGVFDEDTKTWGKDSQDFFQPFNIQYPQYITGLQVKKVNGQVNTYTLSIEYPVTLYDDPNFFEKVFSSVSRSRKIIFTYGDAEMPAYVYRNEEAIITNIEQNFSLVGSTINYTVTAVSSAALSTDGSITVLGTGSGDKKKPSDEIKSLFRNNKSLRDTFTGMSDADLNILIAGDDMAVELESKHNISALDYLNYLVGCMIPIGSQTGLSKEIYALTIHDDSMTGSSGMATGRSGPWFEVRKVSTVMEQDEAYEIDIGINTSTIVRSFTLNQNANYSIYYEYQDLAHPEKYTRILNDDGLWEDRYAPTSMARPGGYDTSSSDLVWWTKATQFPVKANIQVQGLLRPATLLQYVKLNVIFPGGRYHISSGLYIVTSQIDNIGPNGYATNLELTRIKGDMDKI